MRRILVLVLVGCASCAGCTGTVGGEADAGQSPPPDSGQPSSDAGRPDDTIDAGPLPERWVDAGYVTILNEMPTYQPPAPDARGVPYSLPGDSLVLENFSLIMGWRVELTSGEGLAFGGLETRADDPRPPTTLREDGGWHSIQDELRAANPFQLNRDEIYAQRTTLHRLTTRARRILLSALTEADQSTQWQSDVAPLITQVSDALRLAQQNLNAVSATSAQRPLANQHLDAIFAAFAALGSKPTSENLIALNHAEVDLEQAAEVLDAEPMGRSFSQPTFDARTGLYVLWGGDHFDYSMNDLWVFDPTARRWTQRHPAASPEPRGDSSFVATGDGRVVMRGGFVYHQPEDMTVNNTLLNAGPGDWVYDVVNNAWSAPDGGTLGPSDLRTYRHGGFSPNEYGLPANQADAGVHEAVLAAIPTNTWVALNPPMRFPGGRDWAGVSYDAADDLIMLYGGGHAAYSGNDILLYHLASNRWEQPTQTEFGSAYLGHGESIPGWSYNRRAWIPGHSWNSYSFDPVRKRVIASGRQGLDNKYFDKNTYFYDPDLGDWEKRSPTADHFDAYGTQLRFMAPLGMLTWYGTTLYTLGESPLDWAKVPLTGEMLPGTTTDHCGYVNDPTRHRILFFSGGDYNGTAYSGTIVSLDTTTNVVSSFTPEGAQYIKGLTVSASVPDPAIAWTLREVVEDPAVDLFIFSSSLPGGYLMAFDPVANAWVGLKIPGPYPYGLSSGLAYDTKRDLVYSVANNGDVSVVRITTGVEKKSLQAVSGM